MEERPLVSVIVPCYNQAQYLSEALDSVLCQTYDNWECVIVNDGSPDNTDEIAKEYCAKDHRFKYLHQENQGVSAARNNGIKLSQGKYILPLDGDDKIADSYIERAVAYHNDNPKTKVVYCKAALFGLENCEWHLGTYDYESFIWNNCIFNACVFRRSDFDKVGGYNTNMKEGLEDWDFLLSLLKPTDRVFQIDEILFFYRIREASRNKMSLNHTKQLLIQIYRNHKEIYDSYKELVIYYHHQMDNAYSVLKDAVYSKELEIRSSKAYRLGKTLLKPFSLLK